MIYFIELIQSPCNAGAMTVGLPAITVRIYVSL